MDQTPNQDQPQPIEPQAQPEAQSQPVPTPVGAPEFTPAPAPATPTPMVQAENPGKTLGIVGIVLALIGLAPIGLILSIVSLLKSSKAHASKTLGLIGVILNALAVLLMLLLIPVIIVATVGVQDRTKDASALNYANDVVRKAEVYGVENNAYPSSIADFNSNSLSKLTSKEYTVVDGQPTKYNEVGYELCSEDKAVIYYYVTTENTVKAVASDGSGTGC
ncbi:hypothetical protein IPM09_04395 [Candidatus Saccharibacteria bacterium]|nr:MAG: hypothetical protein IPM09_04395 [Candidatus Saccharibacteria bacterium]